MSTRSVRPLLLSALSLLPLMAGRAADPAKLPHLTRANSASMSQTSATVPSCAGTELQVKSWPFWARI